MAPRVFVLNGARRLVLPFCTAHCGVSLYFAMRSPHISPQIIAPSLGGYAPPSNTWFLGPPDSSLQNGISIGSAVFAELTNVTKKTDRQTDRRSNHSTLTLRCNLIITQLSHQRQRTVLCTMRTEYIKSVVLTGLIQQQTIVVP